MNLSENGIYHIYNRGINKQPVFLNESNYIFFLKKLREHLAPVSNILCYSLMPNHFHLLIEATKESVTKRKTGIIEIQQTSYALQHLLSSYTKAFNKQHRRTDSLFTQNTKCKNISENSVNGHYGIICFHYIHQNPLMAGLVKKMEDWKFSSFRDYINMRDGTLINKKRAIELFDINQDKLYEESYSKLAEDVMRNIL